MTDFGRRPADETSGDRRPADIAGARMETLARLPLFFGLNGRRVVVAGD